VSGPLERRFPEEEFRWILDRAARANRPANVDPTSGGAAGREGLTLREIQEIAGEVGVDPVAVEEAAARLSAVGLVRLRPDRAEGRVRGYDAEFEARRPLSEREFRELVREAERVTGESGLLERGPDGASWQGAGGRVAFESLMQGDGTAILRVRAKVAGRIRGWIAFGSLGAFGVLGAWQAGWIGLAVGLPLVAVATVVLVRLHEVGEAARARDLARGLAEDLRALVSDE
jgi:hypothetical protein